MDEAFSNLVREIRKYNKVQFFFPLGLVPIRTILGVGLTHKPISRNNKLAVQSSRVGRVPRVRTITLIGWIKPG